ncbi:MAG: AIPR protein [Candidatus Scalindua rubra]|uniref:AIPR protein n=1 Tax=Candidatus Scalindua rubra TaxID=1872076 RepID=A0A1E3X349_9BACT|nr:MAG: AIPR protein [Candidatus Scalindua rubra]
MKIRQFDDFLNVLNVDFLTRQNSKKTFLLIMLVIQWFSLINGDTVLSRLINSTNNLKKHQLALFDLNVRFHYRRSSVNKEIEKTLTYLKGQKNFHLLNNGISISCVGKKTHKIRKQD